MYLKTKHHSESVVPLFTKKPAAGCHYFPPGPQLPSQPLRGLLPVVKVDRRIRWPYTTTILRLRIGARLTRYRNGKFLNFACTISRHADGISRDSVPPSAGPLLPLVATWSCLHHWTTQILRSIIVEHFLLRVPQRGTVFLSHSETRQSAMPASDGI